MIKSIGTSGRWLTMTGNTSPTPYIPPGAMGAGMMRWNSNMNCIEVNDGNSWKILDTTHAYLDLTPEADAILSWAKKRMEEEKEWALLAENHPAIKIALENLNKAQEQLKATVILSKDYQPNETTSN